MEVYSVLRVAKAVSLVMVFDIFDYLACPFQPKCHLYRFVAVDFVVLCALGYHNRIFDPVEFEEQ